DCSPSLTMSMPASSCSLTAMSVASSFAASSSAPESRHGAHSLFGSASQDGFGRLPATVVGNMRNLLLERDDFKSSSRSKFMLEHDLFPKTGIHFSGSCSNPSRSRLPTIEPIVATEQASAAPRPQA